MRSTSLGSSRGDKGVSLCQIPFPINRFLKVNLSQIFATFKGSLRKKKSSIIRFLMMIGFLFNLLFLTCFLLKFMISLRFGPVDILFVRAINQNEQISGFKDVIFGLRQPRERPPAFPGKKGKGPRFISCSLAFPRLKAREFLPSFIKSVTRGDFLYYCFSALPIGILQKELSF
jgi:hypothetical protein